jgi:hypothetical protein
MHIHGTKGVQVMAWKASGATDLPLSDHDREWDADQAEKRIWDWAGGDESFDPRKVQRVFFAYDSAEPDNKTSYKLPFATVVNGHLKAVPHAIHAVAQVLEGARGGVDLPAAVKADVRKRVEKYYKKMGEEVPW